MIADLRLEKKTMKKKRNYYMRSSILFDESSDEACARIKFASLGPDKKYCLSRWQRADASPHQE